jgi:UDP-2,4-diacetamido-2,4,6-trideoxy-beta-L-altropyranose hydrolase
MNSTKSLFRFDASDRIGYGHAIRSFALSEEFAARGYAPMFLVTPQSVDLLLNLGISGEAIHTLSCTPYTEQDSTSTINLANELNCSWTILDGYSFSKNYQTAIRRGATTSKVLVIDDGIISDFDCNAILNQNLNAERDAKYTSDPKTKLLLGSSYTLFRKTFREAQPAPLRREALNITITFGGADTNNFTASMLRALIQSGATDGRSTRVILGGAYGHHESIKDIPGIDGHNIEIITFSPNIIEHYLWSDLVISAAGSSAWELALLKIPMALIITADNQRAVANPLADRGAAIILGDYQSFNPEQAACDVSSIIGSYSKRIELSTKCADLIDCHGARRVVDALEMMS